MSVTTPNVHTFVSTCSSVFNPNPGILDSQRINQIRELTTYVYVSTLRGSPDNLTPAGNKKPIVFKSHTDYIANLKRVRTTPLPLSLPLSLPSLP